MGCFADCFVKSKRRNSRRRPRTAKTSPCLSQKNEIVEVLQVIDVLKQPEIEKPTDPPPESRRDDERERLNVSGRKKVTFDLNVKVYEELPQEKFTVDLEERNEEREEAEKKEQETTNDSHFQSDSSSSSLISYPPNYRYQNSRDSDDEYDEILDDESDFDDDIDDDSGVGDGDFVTEVNNQEVLVQEQSSESLFSLSIDSRNQNLAAERGDKEVISPLRINNLTIAGLKKTWFDHGAEYDNSDVVDLVLSPVENIAQWKAVKARARMASENHEAKENINLQQDSNLPIIEKPDSMPSTGCQKLNSARLKHSDRVITVDTSLSSWLVEAEGTPNSKTSSVSVGNSSPSGTTISFEDRPILGALTLEEIRQFSATSSPRRSPSRSPDDMPIIGSVGSYWSHIGQTSDSDSGSLSKMSSKSPEDRRVNWNPTPFLTRLEMALQKGTAEA
ncbi:hypothetical protein Ancab_001020 [Ancistrocladus abbreviatus]